MNIQKITIVLTMLLMTHSIKSMQAIKNFFYRDIATIEQDIEKTISDQTLTDFIRHINLSALHAELHEAYTKNNDYNEEKALQIDGEREKHKLAAQEIRKKENKIKYLESKIKKEVNNPQTARTEQLISLIPDYQELTRLNPNHAEYRTKLQKLENIKLRKEVQQQIVELEKINNKEGLLIAYKTLITTFPTEEKKALYKDIIESLESEIEDEKRVRDAELMRVLHYNKLTEGITSTATNKKLSDLARKMQLASLLAERSIIGKDFECYTAQAKDDASRARTLRYEALALAKTTKDSTAEKTLMALITQ